MLRFSAGAPKPNSRSGAEVEKMQHMALHHLAVMHQPAHLLRRGRQCRRRDHVHRLGRGEVVADRADAAQPLHDDRHLPQQPAADEALEAAELDDVQPRLVDRLSRRDGS
jgi:hypothetical protein